MKRIVSIIILVTLVSSLLAGTFATPIKSMSDISGHWAEDSINIINELGYVSGYPDGSFKPENKIKRIEMLSFVLKALNEQLPVVEDGYWGANILARAIELNIVTENESDITYSDYEGYITREEAARVVYNAHLVNNSHFNAVIDQEVRKRIIDFDQVSEMYIDGVVGVFSVGIVEGYEDKSFKPKNTLTRAEAAVLISRFALSDRRIKVSFESSVLKYKGKDEYREESFTLYYSEEHNDIVNLSNLIYYTENEDVLNGFASMNYNEYKNLLNTNIFPDEDSFFKLAPIDVINSVQWSLTCRLTPPEYESSDWIDFTVWRKTGDLDRSNTIKEAFNYLFVADSEEVWNLFMDAYNNKPLQVDKTLNRYTFNNRSVLILNDSIGVSIKISRKINTQLINFENK